MSTPEKSKKKTKNKGKNKIKIPKAQGPDFDLSREEANGGFSPVSVEPAVVTPEKKKEKKKSKSKTKSGQTNIRI